MVHPRVRGEASGRSSASSLDTGPSPRARGSLLPRVSDRICIDWGPSPRARGSPGRPGLNNDRALGSIPACAGKPVEPQVDRCRCNSRGSIPACAGKPRSAVADGRDILTKGPSPRARGKPFGLSPSRRCHVDPGSIPACAGKPAVLGYDTSLGREGPSPRARGSPRPVGRPVRVCH